MNAILTYTLFGYLCGSILFARVAAALFHQDREYEKSEDGNPGTVNAFRYGGFWCGLFTLLFDLLKGFIPVYLFMHYGNAVKVDPFMAALVIAAPVVGHAFPLFYGFHGGKGIAVTFGCLAGLFPALEAFWVLVFFFIGFSTVLQISPHFYRTIFAYAFSLVIMFREIGNPAVVWGFFLITAVVLIRMLTSKEERKCLEVKLLGCSHTLMWDRRRS